MPAPPAVLTALLDRFDPGAFDMPRGRARLRLEVEEDGAWDLVVEGDVRELERAERGTRADARLCADATTGERIGRDVRGGMEAFRSGRLTIRDDLHLGVGFLAATSGMTEPGRLEMARVRTSLGDIAVARAGEGFPVVMLHGLGGTKASFLPTLAALADRYRVLAIDLPGFGDSVKPVGAPYDPHFFARAVRGFLDTCGIERAHLIGNSMGGRVALEVGFRYPERIERIVGLSPSLAWLRDRPGTPPVKALRPALGLLQLAPRPVVEEFVRRFVPGGHDGWSAVGVDEFLRAYLTPRAAAAFYASRRNIYLDEPEGEQGFWTRLRALQNDSLFVWGRQDRLVPIAFAPHVREALPGAQHVELNCGHVPQLEAPRATHAAIRRFFAAGVAGARQPRAA